ncbi:MAG TPA: thiamine ABC transporter permease [Clostridiales bacterium UBA8960]|nr:thiamine ABC transporter permease [Clostridiales bacterium UBA8960]
MILKFIRYYKPHTFLFSLDMLAAFAMAGIDLLFPMFSRAFVNDLIPNGKMNLIIIYSGVILSLYFVKIGLTYFMGYWGHVLGSRIEFDMRRDLFTHIQKLEFSFFDNIKTGQLMNRLTADLNEVTELAHHGPEDLFVSLVMLIGSFILLAQINLALTLIIFFFVILTIVFSILMRKSMIITFRSVRSALADINAQLESSLSGIRLSKSFANESFEIEKFHVTNHAHLHSKKDSFKAIASYSAGNGFFIDMMTLSSMVAGGIFVYKGLINYGDLLAFLLFISFFTKPIRALIQLTQQFQSGTAGFERFLEMMDMEPKIVDCPDAKDLVNAKGEITFDRVTFAYEKDADPVLKDFSLTIPSGKTIALVGPSGVGKTTITQLIPRFYDVNEGQVAIDGHDIRSIAMASLRSHIGIVQQDVFLFYGTIRDNIAYGKPDATDDEIVEAAKKANIHDFIVGLDEGYNAFVGERGVKLSGGQKQRIAISRVFLKNPPILILDEATSALDNENEFAIQKSIEKLSKDRTTLIIAHRLSTIKNADEILVMTDQGINERGSHEELLRTTGLYSKLYHAQFKGYIPDALT